MNNKITTIGIAALTATLLTLSGCSPVMRAAKLEQKLFDEDPMKFFSVKEHIELNQPKYARGLVETIIDQDIYDELLDFYDGDNAHFQRVFGPSYSLDTVREKYDLVSVITAKGFDTKGGGGVFVPKSAKVEVGDIIDVYWGEMTSDSYEALARREYNEYAADTMDRGFFISVETPTQPNTHAMKHSRQFLAIVCKHDEAGCKYNSSPKTKIGDIRPAVNQHYDYRGPENEFVSREMIIRKFFSNCFGCDDEADREYLRQKGLIK